MDKKCDNKGFWNRYARLYDFEIKKFNGKAYSEWKPDEYVEFIRQNGFKIERWQLLNAAFPLVYIEARKILNKQ